MAYKQKGCTPVTAKVQKTTKGGMVQQPLLNMGAPVKMKSPAKQDGRQRAKAKAEEPKNNKGQIDRLKLEISSMTDTLENYKKKWGKIVASDANYLQKKKEELASLSPYLGTGSGGRLNAEAAKARANKNKAAKNNTKKDIAIEKVAGGYFGNTLGKDKPKDPNRIYFPIEIKKDNNKDIVNPPKPSKVTGKIGSDLRKQQYDKLGWKYDSTINVPKEKTSNVTKEKTGDVVKTKNVEAIKPNEEAKKVVEAKTTKKAEKKINVAENKETRAAKVRAKGEKALAEGNKGKALRLKRREEGILKRAQKKRNQASKAIEPN